MHLFGLLLIIALSAYVVAMLAGLMKGQKQKPIHPGDFYRTVERNGLRRHLIHQGWHILVTHAEDESRAELVTYRRLTRLRIDVMPPDDYVRFVDSHEEG